MMKNIPAKLRDELKSSFICASSGMEEVCESPDGTKKLLIKLSDGELIEAVIIPSPDRITFCLSAQVGCPVQCRFCASGMDGLVRNMKAGEIIEQFYHACSVNGDLPDNIVFMGIGEGLLNFDNLLESLNILSAPEKIGMAARRITVSSSGWVPGIKKLAEQERQFNLAVSLHAPDDKLRAQLIPDKFRCPINDIVEACIYYRKKTNRMTTFEYTLLKGINDRPEHAEALAKLALKCRSKVNLIPFNGTSSGKIKYERPSKETVKSFEGILKSRKVSVTVRVEKGSSDNAACGQLRAQKKQG
jgi:23S rRNA (adenine2503-C2)-methyltransferase